jgi:hypothetical protein
VKDQEMFQILQLKPRIANKDHVHVHVHEQAR